MFHLWKDIQYILRKLTISPMRKQSLQHLSRQEQLREIGTLVRKATPVLVALHIMQTSDTQIVERISFEKMEAFRKLK